MTLSTGPAECRRKELHLGTGNFIARRTRSPGGPGEARRSTETAPTTASDRPDLSGQPGGTEARPEAYLQRAGCGQAEPGGPRELRRQCVGPSSVASIHRAPSPSGPIPNLRLPTGARQRFGKPFAWTGDRLHEVLKCPSMSGRNELGLRSGSSAQNFDGHPFPCRSNTVWVAGDLRAFVSLSLHSCHSDPERSSGSE